MSFARVLVPLLLACTVRAQARTPVARPSHATGTLEAVRVAGTRAVMLLTVQVEPGWHISWRNPGDTGLPTELVWSLPAGVSVETTQWPIPLVTHTPVGVTHTLDGAVPWLVTLRLPPAGAADRLLGVTLRYGVCRDVCIPTQLVVQGAVPAAGTTLVPLPAATAARLARDGGVIAARRQSRTTLCLDRLPAGFNAPEVIADSGSGVAPALTPRRVRGAAVLTVPAEARVATGSQLLFVEGPRGATARLDLSRPAPACAAR